MGEVNLKKYLYICVLNKKINYCHCHEKLCPIIIMFFCSGIIHIM